MNNQTEIQQHPGNQTHVLDVFVIKFIVESLFNGLLLFGDFVKSGNLHARNHHLKITDLIFNAHFYDTSRITHYLNTYRLFPLNELALCEFLIRYKLEPEHPCVAAVPEEKHSP